MSYLNVHSLFRRSLLLELLSCVGSAAASASTSVSASNAIAKMLTNLDLLLDHLLDHLEIRSWTLSLHSPFSSPAAK